MTKLLTRGITAAGVVAIIALVVIVGIIVSVRSQSDPNVEPLVSSIESDSMMGDPADEMMSTDDHMMDDGRMMAGAGTPLLDFTKSDYDAALASGKLVALYFYANWCPICRAEFPLMQAAFQEFPGGETAIGFRVNYNDNETDSDEVAVARQFGVAYQHTKVFLKDGAQVLKSPESWTKERYLAELNRLSAE